MAREGRHRPRDTGGTRPKTLSALSSGGVVFRRPGGKDGVAEIVLVGQSRTKRWGLPKGAPAGGETLEEAALREVKEETGVDAEIVERLGHIEYWFAGQGVRYHKIVHFYLMRAVGGDIAQHDLEHDVVEWFPIDQAEDVMSYVNEKQVVHRAAEILHGADHRHP